MIIPTLLALAAGSGFVGYLLGTASGKAEVAKLKADVSAEIVKVEAAVKADVAVVKADVTNAIAKVKALVAKL
ncbi:MAG: hypothetical protein WCC95_18565 [Candidatus Sulfotelmatobacter sp.]